MTDDAFTERQRAHAQQFQEQMQALYAHLPDPHRPPAAPTLAERLSQALGALEQLRAALPDPVHQGKVQAALHILGALDVACVPQPQEGRR